MTVVRELPKNIEAEQVVIGSAILEPDSVVPEILQNLKPEHFYQRRHRVIFTAIRELASRSKPTDIVSLANRLEELDLMERAGGRMYLNELMDRVVTTGALDYYTEIVREKAVKRAIVDIGSRISELGYDEEAEASALLDRSLEMLTEPDIVSSRAQISTIQEAFGSWDEQIRRLRSGEGGMTSGYSDLDQFIRGTEAQTIVIAGMPGLGKSAMGLNMIYRQAKAGIKSAIVSLEMPKEAVVERLVQIEGRMTSDDLLYKPGQVDRAAKRLLETPLKIIAMDTSSSVGIIQQMRLLNRQGFKSFFVDYLQLMKLENAERRDLEIGESLRLLLEFSKHFGACVITASQVNRSAMIAGERGRPRLHQMKESSGVEAHADIILGLWRPSYTDSDEKSNELAVEFLKNRKLGHVGRTIKFVFDRDRQTIEMEGGAPF